MISFTVALSIMVLAAHDAAAQPFSVGARAGRAAGTLVIDADEMAFRSEKTEDARQWPYAAIRVLRIDAPNRLTIETYEARGWLLKHGHQRVTYTIVGEGLPSAAVEFLLDRVARPMVTRVLPSPLERPVWILQVRHERRGDDAPGTLELYTDGVAFRGVRPADTRFWRFRDLASLLPLDPFRIEITAREADELKPFTFQLAQELPAGFRDAVWTRINAPAKTPVEALQPPTVAGVRR
jgi:hypothetical protein